MKKTGFTLAELLVSLGVVGIIAALTIPMIHRIMPDKDKGMVLKAYRTISEINENILKDPSLYIPCTDANGPLDILKCDTEPADGLHSGYSGKDKYPKLLCDNLSLASACSSSSDTYTFTTADGIKWTITYLNTQGYSVTVDVGNPVRKSCLYDKNTCDNPRWFKFEVKPDGRIEGDDNLTKAYLLNPSRLNDRNADLAKAKSL